jgi:hypothetical protein
MGDIETRGEIRWRTLRTGLWAARRDDRHLGTVERGRRWLAVDADSEPIGRFRTLREAQAAVACPASHRTVAQPLGSGSGTGMAGLLALAATASAAAIAVAWPVLSELIR